MRSCPYTPERLSFCRKKRIANSSFSIQPLISATLNDSCVTETSIIKDLRFSDYEKLASFYLGRDYDLYNESLGDDLVL